MIDFKNAAVALAMSLAVIAATPAMAKNGARHPGHDARAQAIQGDAGGASMSADRDRALRECSEIAAPLRQYTWGVYQGYQFRSCMNEHGQQE
jgi:hypothetical protein